MLGLKIDFELQPFQAKFSHHPKMSTQESLLETKEILIKQKGWGEKGATDL